MAKTYPAEFLDKLIKDNCPPIIVELIDGSVFVGYLESSYAKNRYHLRAIGINEGGTNFSRSMIKRIIHFSGFVIPKSNPPMDQQDSLSIIELSDLIGKAGYEFI